MNYAAVITAGGRVDGKFARVIGTRIKALAPFAGGTFLSRTIAAARGIGIERIAVVGGEEVRRSCAQAVETVIDEDSDGARNLIRALSAWPQDPLIYLTSDMPFVNPDALRALIAAAPAGTLCVPITFGEAFELHFPNAPPFGLTLCGRRLVNGGAFVIPAQTAGAIASIAPAFFNARKSVLRMAVIAGPAVLTRYALKRLRVSDLEDRAARVLGVPAKAIRDAPPELAYDVDTLEEYRYALTRAG